MLINESAHTVDTPSGPMRMNVFSPAVAGSPRFPGIVVFSEIYQVLHVGPKKNPSASAFIRLTRLVSGDGPCRSAGAGNRRRRVKKRANAQGNGTHAAVQLMQAQVHHRLPGEFSRIRGCRHRAQVRPMARQSRTNKL